MNGSTAGDRCMMSQGEIQDELADRRSLTREVRGALDEVVRHSLGRTGKVARAIESGLAALRCGAVLAPLHREALEEFSSMVSESTPSADGAGIGTRYVHWRDAVRALLGALRPAPPSPIRELIGNLAASMTPRQAELLTHPLSEQQHRALSAAMAESQADAPTESDSTSISTTVKP